MTSVKDWINERWPLDALTRLSLEEEMIGGTSYSYVFGSSLLTIFLLQVITGIWQLFYFVPTVDHGYISLSYFRTQVPFGWLIHGLHYWGASAMIILIGLHLSRVFLWGAYKHPRQLTWLIGVFLLLFTLGLGFTGPVLPWDERGYWEAEVGTSMAGTVPYVGTAVANLLRGGPDLGQKTLSRFFVLHVALLPTILIILISLHLVAFRKSGISGPWDPVKRGRTGAFWPDQVFKDAVIITLIFTLLVGLSAYLPPPFSGLKDVRISSYTPKPEWYFLFLYQTLKAFHGPLETVGTIGIPLIVIFILLFLPFFDRSPERNPKNRPVVLVGYLIFITWVVTMAFVGYYSKPGAGGPSTGSEGAGDFQAAMVLADPPDKMSAGAKKGEQLFGIHGCIGCHKVNGRGGSIGPDLSSGVLKEKSRQWITVQIQDPKKHFPGSIMPAFSSLSKDQLNELADFLMTLGPGKVASSGPPPGQPEARTTLPETKAGRVPPSSSPGRAVTGPQGPAEQAAYVIGDPGLGKSLFMDHCQMCHGPQGTDKVPNPGSADGTVPSLNPIDPALSNRDPEKFAEDIDRYIQHGSVPKGTNPALHMLPFGDSESLSQAMISDLEAYILQLNHVNRAEAVNPGLQPGFFFWLTAAAFGTVWLVLFVLWI